MLELVIRTYIIDRVVHPQYTGSIPRGVRLRGIGFRKRLKIRSAAAITRISQGP